MRRFSIFLSCEKYSNYSDTPYCHADSRLLRKTLIEKCDYSSDTALAIELMPNDGTNATEIMKSIQSLLERTEDGDTILFFYAGHGVVVDNSTYLVLPDTSPHNQPSTSLKISDVAYLLSKNKCVNVRIFDCCHSGEDVRGKESETATDEFVRLILSQGNDCSITLASCAPNEKSHWDEAKGHGVFTLSLVSAIENCNFDEQIYAESIKIPVCIDVQSWAKERGKSQTPTLNAHIVGNMPIARRKSVEIAAAPNKGSERASILQRLEKLKKQVLVDKEFYPELTKSINEIYLNFSSQIQKNNPYSISLIQQEAENSHEIPRFIKEKIISLMKSYDTIHTMVAIQEERPQPKTFGWELFERKPVYFTSYHINQKSDMPSCYLQFLSTTDGYLPSSGIFFYICPLQATIALVYGYYFDRAYNNSDSDVIVKSIKHQLYSIEDFIAKKYLLSMENLSNSYQSDLEIEINRRVTHLEQEFGSVAI